MTRMLVCVFLLALPLSAGEAGDDFRFTVVGDMREEHEKYRKVLQAMVENVGNEGVFQIALGDIDGRVWENRAIVDEELGPDALWYPGIGNHEAEDEDEMKWLRSEYHTGNNLRAPLSEFTNKDGPAGSKETSYSWDYDAVRFIYINEYWDGRTIEGSDVARDGDVVPELLSWLEDRLRETKATAVFVLGHEPAFPQYRHIGDSLDKYKANRDAFWRVLERRGAVAYMCSHTHVYSLYRKEGGNVWQIDVGNAGKDSELSDLLTFLDVIVGPTDVRFDVWRNARGNFHLEHSWTQRLPRVFLGGFENGEFGRWTSVSPDDRRPAIKTETVESVEKDPGRDSINRVGPGVQCME